MGLRRVAWPKATGVPLLSHGEDVRALPEAVCAWGGFGPWVLCIRNQIPGCGTVQFLSSSAQLMSVEVMRQLQQPTGRRAAP